MKQERVRRPRRSKTDEVGAEDVPVEDVAVGDGDADLLTDIDDLLDEIDAVLEDQSRLTEFRQRSGE